MLGDQLRAYALASARTSTSTGAVGAPSGGVGRSAGISRGTDEISVPVAMTFPLKGITGSTSRKARYVQHLVGASPAGACCWMSITESLPFHYHSAASECHLLPAELARSWP